jgi:hypothetical protein
MLYMMQGKALEVKSLQACILYDSDDGSVAHRHEVVNFADAVKTDAEVQADAYRLASQLGLDVTRLKALIPPAGTYSSQKAYKLDVKSQELVEVPHAEDQEASRRLF